MDDDSSFSFPSCRPTVYSTPRFFSVITISISPSAPLKSCLDFQFSMDLSILFPIQSKNVVTLYTIDIALKIMFVMYGRDYSPVRNVYQAISPGNSNDYYLYKDVELFLWQSSN